MSEREGKSERKSIPQSSGNLEEGHASLEGVATPQEKRGAKASSPVKVQAPVRRREKESASGEFDEDSPLAERGRAEALRSGATGENLQDFLSEFFLGCWLSPDPDNMALTCTCGTNQARSYLRRERLWQTRVSLETAGDAPHDSNAPSPSGIVYPMTPEGSLLAQELLQRILAVLSGMTPLQQRVLHLRHRQGLSFSEIASQTGQSVSAARVMARVAQRRLLVFLESEGMVCGEACEYLSLLERCSSDPSPQERQGSF